MKLVNTTVASLLALAVTATAGAAEGPAPTGVPHLDHVFLIVMENHSYGQIIGNPAMPYINAQIAKGQVNLASNYFAVGHPSLTNYLELVGGSNFGVRSDNNPDWHNLSCQPNLATGHVNADGSSNTFGYIVDQTAICPISGSGTDAATEAVDNWNEISAPIFNLLANIDGVKSVPAVKGTSGKTIADQLVEHGLSWKSYQESLPVTGADQVNSSNGTATDSSYAALQAIAPGLPASSGTGLVADYAVKHNPFAYFASVQEGRYPGHSLKNTVGFDGQGGLYADLASGHVPTFSLIAPNQCDDQHGRGNGDAFCQYDPGIASYSDLTNGTQVGMSPGLSAQADVTLNRIVGAITASPVWHQGLNAIVVVWDENDYSGIDGSSVRQFAAGNLNKVVLTVQTSGPVAGVTSNNFYDSYSVLKSIEGGLGLPCLNHACDKDVAVMSDLFSSGRGNNGNGNGNDDHGGDHDHRGNAGRDNQNDRDNHNGWGHY